MSENPVDDALLALGDSLSMVDTARHALGTILEDLHGHPAENIGFCILHTLDAAAEQGQDSLKIIEEGGKEKAA